MRALLAATAAFLLLFATAASADVRVSVGNTTFSPFSQNKQNEPAVAVDAANPSHLAGGANDNIDMEACNAGRDDDCPFTDGVGVSGIYFSSDQGTSWTQPTYRGYSARVNPTCNPGRLGNPDPDPAKQQPGDFCEPDTNGPIGTLPKYYENGLVSDGDPALAFGPRYVNGAFTKDGRTTLYYANLTSAFPGKAPFKGAEAIAVSRANWDANTPPPTQAQWSDPVIASKQSSAQFSDKEQIWADNAATSPFFGSVYVCYANFRSNSATGGNQPLDVLISRDGARSFTQKQVTSATNNPNSRNGFGRSGCTVRTDSEGNVYVFDYQFAAGAASSPGQIQMIKSTDGGKTFGRPRNIFTAYDTCNYVEPSIGRCVSDGVGGARSDLAPAPSVDIANGAPSGTDATDRLVLSWVDGRNGGSLNPYRPGDETVQFSTSANGGDTWAPAQRINPAGERGYYAAPSISPNGNEIYVVYNAFTTPFAINTGIARTLIGVVRKAAVDSNGVVGPFVEAARSTKSGDARSSSQNNLAAEFLGDYVYSAATRSYSFSVWNDVRNGTNCTEVDNYRQALHDEAAATGQQTAEPEEPRGAEDGAKDAPGDVGSTEPPEPQNQCAPNFGESDIYGARATP